MTRKISQTLDGVPQTLLMTLLVRARETQHTDGVLRDEKAVEMISRLDADFSKLIMQRHDEIAVLLRMRKFDKHVRAFLARNPDGVVVHIGCGLDTRYNRIGDDHVEWFDLDVPEVMELRKKLIPTEAPHYHTITSSVFETDWLADVEPFNPRPFLFIAEGVLPYFEESQVRELFLRLRDHFPGAELVCDGHTPFVIWADNIHLAIARVKARLRWKLKNPRDVETWGAGLRLIDAWDYSADDDPLMESFRLIRMIPALAKSSGIYHFQLGTRV
jgi:O-methyltransferase involved in polyketide biosynthesis